MNHLLQLSNYTKYHQFSSSFSIISLRYQVYIFFYNYPVIIQRGTKCFHSQVKEANFGFPLSNSTQEHLVPVPHSITFQCSNQNDRRIIKRLVK